MNMNQEKSQILNKLLPSKELKYFQNHSMY